MEVLHSVWGEQGTREDIRFVARFVRWLDLIKIFFWIILLFPIFNVFMQIPFFSTAGMDRTHWLENNQRGFSGEVLEGKRNT